MNLPRITNRQLIELVTTYWHWRWLWLSAMGLFAGLGLFYVLFLKGDTWVASQGLIVRDEANGAVMRLGRFESQTAMKAAQETVLEMARNSQVVSDALTTIGREPGLFSWFSKNDAPPSTSEIDQLAKHGIEVRAPRGAELGTTEVIYLDVKQSSRERAMELNKAVCDALENRLKQVRQARADGVISELLAARVAATANLQESTEFLQNLEAAAGADLSDLRGLTDNIATGSSIRQLLDTVKAEQRAAELEVKQIEVDLATAKESYEDPDKLLQTPNKLVNNQAGLKQMREGLATANIASSQLQGRYTISHPLVVAAKETENQIRTKLRNELGTAVQTLTKEADFARARVNTLKLQQASLEDRIAKLAEIRAGYANVASEVRARNEQLQGTERALAQAQAARDAAMTSSLITRLENPILGEKPIGPGRSTILAGATVGGMFFGFGLVFLLTPLDGSTNYGRRRLDFSGVAGRRASDMGQPSEMDRGPLAAAVAPRPDRPSTPATEPIAAAPPAGPVPAGPVPAGPVPVSRTPASPIHVSSRSARTNGLSNAAEAAPKLTRPAANTPRNAAQGTPDLVRAPASTPAPVEAANELPMTPPVPLTPEQESLRAAQSVIAAALQCSFSAQADAAPIAPPQVQGETELA